IARYLPTWSCGPSPEWRARVTIAHLLTHTSGLPAHEKYFQKGHGRRKIVSHAIGQRLAYEPGKESIYSDIGFIVLGEIIRELTGRDLDQLAAERIFKL